MQRAHGIEEMCNHCCTLTDSLGRLFVCCLGVANRVDDASGRNLWDEIHHLPAFWCRRDHLDGQLGAVRTRCYVFATVASLDILNRVSLGKDIDIVDSVLGRIQERTLAMSAERFGAVTRDPQFPRRTKVWEGLPVALASCTMTPPSDSDGDDLPFGIIPAVDL